MLNIKVDTQEEKEEELDFPYLAEHLGDNDQIVLLLSTREMLLCSGYDERDGNLLGADYDLTADYKPYDGEITIKNK